MIRFACRCRSVLQTPDDQAGLTIQCPQCGLLVDIPRLSDKDNLEGDGTYRVGTAPAPRPEDSLDNLVRIYYPGTRLSDGTEIDLRGPAHMPPADPGAPPPGIGDRPKYDPETGELVQPLNVEQASAPPIPRELPEARRVIDYNLSPDALRGSPHGIAIFAELLQPLNIIVMLIIMGIHLFLLIAIIVTMAIPLIIVLPFFIVMFLAGHYTSVLEEMGPAERDELPRPLRNVHPYDDFIAPFGRSSLTLLLCYWPMAVVLLMNFSAAMRGQSLPFPNAGLWLTSLFVAGSVFLPAVFLTICTSGALLNLRPDRLLGVIYASGWRYPLFVVLWIAAVATYLYGVLATTIGMASMFSASGPAPIPLRAFVTYPILMLGIYLTHAFCWLLGVHYRKFWSTFPWVAQYHEHKTVAVRPKLHPKVAASDDKTAARANQRKKRIR